MDTEIPPLAVRAGGADRSLPPGPAYLIGRDPACEIVIDDARVSWQHAVLRLEGGRWVLADNGSTNGIYLQDRRVDRIEIDGECLIRLSDPAEGPPVSCTVSRTVSKPAVREPAAGEPAAEIPYAVRWLVPRGERFANFGILNNTETQLDYYRRFGHIYAVGIPAKKWRLVVVSDPELLDEVAADEEQFGKRVEEINFFAQLSNSRGAGLSVIGDGEHYERVRRVMLPWYAPSHQRTQLERMKDQARKLVAAWSALPAGEPVDARAWMERYTLEVSGRGACAYDFGLLDGDPQSCPHPFAAAVPASTKESILRVAEPRPDFTLFAGRARRERKKAYRRHNAELFRTAEALVQGRRHTTPLGQQTDLLSRLLSTPDPETGQFLDTETVRDQILMHLSNGFNGPSITGAWLAYILATRPEVTGKVMAEIDAITGGDPDYDLQYDDLLAMTYTTQVIKETLRIYPPQPVTIRRSLKDGTLGRYRIRKGDIILVGTLAAQRDPRYWGPFPDRFDPEQFALTKVADRPRHAFIPFSVGKRQCMAQEVTFMMLRVVVFEICRNFELRLAPGATVTKNTVVTTKPATVPVVLLPRPRRADRRQPAPAAAAGQPAAAPGAAVARDWGEPTEIPATSAYRHLVIAYGSNFGANKELAERFAERSDFYGYTSDVMTLNDLADSPPHTEPWLLLVMTSTYTSNPPSNAAAFKSWLERTAPGSTTWRNCRYLVWGLGNTQWNAFLAFPRYVHGKLAELGAAPLAELGYGDVGSPGWERLHADWHNRVWPVLRELSGARPSEAATVRAAAREAATGALTGTDSHTAMQRSLRGEDAAPRRASRATSITSIMNLMSFGRTGSVGARMLSPAILTNSVGIDTVEARVRDCRELQAAESPKRTRHLTVSLPPGVAYRAGDHLGVCPRNDEDRVERLARHLGAALDGLFVAPKTADVHAVPKGVVLQVRNALTNLIDITGRPALPLFDLLLGKVADPGDTARLMAIRDDPRGYDVVRLLDEFPSCTLNIFEFLQVAQPLRPRYYSASSSPLIHGDEVVHVTVGLAALPGMCSHYLHSLREGDRLNVFVDQSAGFRLQQDVTKPMIFVSAGTGFAPMRAFGWERLAMRRAGVRLGEAALFNGIRSSSLDYIYRDEIERFTADGVLDHVHVATSRERPGRRDYVQDRIREQGALVWHLLAAGAYVYVCGAQPMRDAVRAAFADVIAGHGSLCPEDAEAHLHELEMTTRYRPDLWG